MPRGRAGRSGGHGRLRNAPDGAEPLDPVELLVLEAVDDVEARHPEEDGEAEKDGRKGEGPRDGHPGADRGDGECKAEEEVGEGGDALGVRVTEDDRKGNGER